jgi:hypothetical protein
MSSSTTGKQVHESGFFFVGGEIVRNSWIMGRVRVASFRLVFFFLMVKCDRTSTRIIVNVFRQQSAGFVDAAGCKHHDGEQTAIAQICQTLTEQQLDLLLG